MGLSLANSLVGAAGEVTLEPHDNGVRVLVDGKLFTEYLPQCGAKPALWPIIGPTGVAMTRAYPMENVDGEKHDHPHHRSLWFTHGDVNGVDFWAEGDRKGRTLHREYRRQEATADGAVIETANDWVDADGKKVCEDVRTLTFRAEGDRRIVDFDITLVASEGPLVFGDTKEGTFGVRVPTVMDVDQQKGGKITTSEGLKDGAAWGKPASWVDYCGPVDGETVGMAILNHPSSFRYPTHWHVRTYGLFAANPFGVHDFTGGEAHAGELKLAAGESITLRYRVIFHKGDAETAKIAQAFAEYAGE